MELSEAEAWRVIAKAGSPLAANTEWPPNLYRKLTHAGRWECHNQCAIAPTGATLA